MEFKEKLKSLRQDRNLTRKQLADLTGISVSSIEKYEYGLKVPRLDNVTLMAEALNCNSIELISSLDTYRDIYKMISDSNYIISKDEINILPDSVKNNFFYLLDLIEGNYTKNKNIQ